MTLAPVETLQDDCALLEPAMFEVAGDGPLSIERLGGGRNSRVYRVDHRGASSYVAKIYHAEDRSANNAREGWQSFPLTSPRSLVHRNRDRRRCEFAALRFLWKNGIRCIPEPVATYTEESLSILKLVDGEPIATRDISSTDIDALIAFHDQLEALRHLPASRALPEASEACFSLDALAENLQGRLISLRFAAGIDSSPARLELRDFLADAYAPILERAFDNAEACLAKRGIAADSQLPIESRTLSPSDFGMHNAVRRPDGTLVFVDFEHFGWDDPAKLVSDFLLHPAIPLNRNLRQYFMIAATTGSSTRAEQAWRVPIVYPIYALKWCTILLNEFVTEHQVRRDHARAPSRSREAVLFEQLAKAHSMLEVAAFALEKFPHAA